MNTRILSGVLYATGYLASIVLAAVAVEKIGPVPVGFGLVAPAGAYVIGVTMVLRDLTQDKIGPRWTGLAMLVGAALSVFVSPALALAAAAAFVVSEAADMAVYTPLRKKSLVGAVLASNAVGIILDSFIFLYIAFGSMEFFAGQAWAKAGSTVLVIVVLKLIYRGRASQAPAYIQAREGAAV